MKTLNAKKGMKTLLVTALSAFALLTTACGKSGSSTTLGYGAYTNGYSNCPTCVSGVSGMQGTSAIGMIRSVALQADIGLQFISTGSSTLQVQGTMVVGSGGSSCPVSPGSYPVTGQLTAISGASAYGYLNIGGTQNAAFLNVYLENRTVTSQYLGAANYLMANTLQINGCGPAFYFQVN